METRTKANIDNYYTLLGIAPTATKSEIRRAYRNRARLLHPDHNHERDAAGRFGDLNRAYETLIDDERRLAYDRRRSSIASSLSWTEAVEPHVRERVRRAHDDPRATAEPSLRGIDVYVDVDLSLRQAAFGIDKQVPVQRRDVCPHCHGRGAPLASPVRRCPRCHGTGRGYQRGDECPRCHGNGLLTSSPCGTCNGSGRVDDISTFSLHFPPATDDESPLHIRNEGDPGPQGGPRGDLILRVCVTRDPVLTRRGSEVYAEITISLEQARRGETIRVPTLREPRRLKLPANVKDESHFTLRGQGLRLKGRWRRGDQHITVRVQE